MNLKLTKLINDAINTEINNKIDKFKQKYLKEIKALKNENIALKEQLWNIKQNKMNMLDREEELVNQVCKKHKISPELIYMGSRLSEVVKAKREIAKLLKIKWYTLERIAHILNFKAHRSVLYLLKS